NNATLTNQIAQQLHELKNNSMPLSESWIVEYEQNWVKPQSQSQVQLNEKAEIVPNKMQEEALQELQGLIKNGQKRGLVVSATGTGKTYLGAFAVKDFKPQKFLYVVHREQIAKKALKSFHQVIGGKSSDYGLLTGHKHQLERKYVFATVQTLSQPDVLASLKATTFDYILIDEAHRAAAPSYQRIFAKFKPQFWLGMTATPERMDDQDVYRLFDYNLAYEIRLREALEEKMLAPFHYVGVEDYEVDGATIDETTNLRRLLAPERVDYVLKQLDYYGYCGSQAKGLVFCSRQEEARELAQSFSERKHPAIALTNEDSEKRRLQVVRQLEQGKIDYIITVDLFNEGIDIPALNQIIMLRNTQSSIVFIQQLGRGLRKYPGKDYVTVIDFIGNYKNNYLIPIALNQDDSRSQDKARQESVLPGFIDVSTINFSQIASAQILASLEQIKLDSIKELRQSYQELAQKIGRPPLLFDFYRYGSTSPMVFANNHSLEHYGEFLAKMGEPVKLSRYESAVLSFVTK
ncbi:MAG: DEAD/DEAH box helicase, partial [Lactobacillus sp.]|nr:DEAD/DEAH box helicase [Lactobacillus sp.]